MLLSVVIVSYNVKYYLWQCLHSLFRAAEELKHIDERQKPSSGDESSCRDVDFEVFVVDNNSKDDTLKMLEREFPPQNYPQLHILANKDNPGFGRANNQAFRLAKGEYVMCLNPDTFISETLLADCIRFMRSHPDAGCLGVRMLNHNGSFAPESRRSIPTPWASFCKITRLSRLFPKSRVFGRYYLQHLPIDQPAPIEIVSGACMMARRQVVADVGPFDEDFFMYCEDTDLAYRMLKKGYQNYYIPTPILHYKGESTRRNTYSYVNNFYKSIFVFFQKHYNAHISILRVLFNIAVYVLATGSFVSNNLKKARYYLHTTLRPHKTRLLFLCPPENEDVCAQLIKKYGVDVKVAHIYNKVETTSSDSGAESDYSEIKPSAVGASSSALRVENLSVSNASSSLGNISADMLSAFHACVKRYHPDYVVYDTSRMSLRQILDLSYSLPAKSKRPIATFYPQKNIILTNYHIFSL